MRTNSKQRSNHIAYAGVAAALLGLPALPCVSYAQDSTSGYGSQSAAASDASIAARVKQALDSDQGLDSRHIDVAMEHGQVVLKGFVQDNRALLDAGRVASKAAGDRKVVNQITIKQNFPNAP